MPLCNYNHIRGNTLKDNTYGIHHYSGHYNVITENHITENNWGLHLNAPGGASSDYIYHNNFVDNTPHVIVSSEGHVNFWDNGYPAGGNYWDDYSGADLYRGPNQDQPGSARASTSKAT